MNDKETNEKTSEKSKQKEDSQEYVEATLEIIGTEEIEEAVAKELGIQDPVVGEGTGGLIGTDSE